jgi:hypothetical protein
MNECVWSGENVVNRSPTMTPKVPKPLPPEAIERLRQGHQPIIRRDQLRPARLHHYVGAVCTVAMVGAMVGVYRLAEITGKFPYFSLSLFVVLLLPAALIGASFNLLKVFCDRYWYRQ